MSETAKNGESQLDKFTQAARELECDDDDQQFKERLGRLVKTKDEAPKDIKKS